MPPNEVFMLHVIVKLAGLVSPSGRRPRRLATRRRTLNWGRAVRPYTVRRRHRLLRAVGGDLALFHKDFEHSPQLVKLGSIDSGVEPFASRGLKATIEQIKK